MGIQSIIILVLLLWVTVKNILVLFQILQCNKSILALLLMMLTLSLKTHSQDVKVTRDLGLWVEVGLEKIVLRDIELSFQQQLRFYNNLAKIDDYFIDFGIAYTINKNFKLGVNGQCVYNVKRDESVETNFRYSFDFKYKTKIGHSTILKYRLRYQKEYVNAYAFDPSQKIYSSEIRHRVKIALDKNRPHCFYLSAELFRLIEIFREPYFNQWRFCLGDEVKLKVCNISYELGYEREIQSNHPYSFLFIKVGCTFKF